MKHGGTNTPGGYDHSNAYSVTWHDDWRADNARQRIKTPLGETIMSSSSTVQSKGVTYQNYAANNVQSTVQSGAGPKAT